MANVWMTSAQMSANFPLYDVDTFNDIWSAQYLNTDNEYVDCPGAEKAGVYERGVNDTTCDMSWWTGGGSEGNSRYICRYNLYCTRFATDQPAMSARRLKIQFPIYMRNVKYLDIAFLIWIDLGYARGATLASYNDVSGIAYTKNGETLKLYCIPTPGNDHPGTGRLAEGSYGPGFIPFHFVYDDEENPIDIDFLEIESSGAYTDRHPTLQYDEFSFWVVQPCYNDDAEFDHDPVPPEPEEGNWGEDSTSGGGNGTFNVTQDNLTPSGISIQVRTDRFNDVFNNGGINVYQINTMDFGTIIGILYGSDFWDKFKNSMFNPLSAVLSCHLLPANLRGTTLTGRDKHLTLAGFDVSAEMSTPINFPLISSMCRYVVGSFDFNNPRYSDSFTDFAPNTIAILHLPYIGECEIDVNAFMYGTLTLEYVCDNVSGNCAAWVWNVDRNGNGRLKYVFTGNCATNVPLFSMSQDGSAVGRVAAQAVIGIGAIALGVGLTAATGGTGAGVLALGGVAKRIGARTLASAAVGGLALGATKAATDGLSTAQHLQSTGGVSGNAGALGEFNAWLEIIRPVWSNPSEYQKLNGIPSNTSTKLSSCLGFTQVTSIEIEGCTATAEEVEELKSILESGIIIKSV